MAQFMAKLPMVASRTSNAGTVPTYASGTAIGKGISITATPNASSTELYGDDAIAEVVSNPVQGTVAISTTTLPNTAAQLMYGVTVAEITPAVTGLTQNNVKFADADCPFTGFGWIDAELVNKVRTYIVHWLPKVQWQLPARTAATRGQTVQFNTPTINGNYYYDDEYGALEDQFQYSGTGAEAAAIAKLKALCGITEQASSSQT